MGNFLNMDNPFFSTMSKICDMILLSLLWMICCIPIITIGPATTALYYTTVKVIRRERSYLFREFFHSFRQNFKQGAIIGTLLFFAYILLIFDRQWANGEMAINEKLGFILFNVFNALIIILTFFAIYIFPVLSRFSMKTTTLIKSSFVMAIRHLPSTIVMTLITAAFILINYYLYFFLVWISPALCMFLNSFFMERILKKYTPKTEEETEETSTDAWYLE